MAAELTAGRVLRVLRPLARSAALLLVVCAAVFALTELLPGDAATVRAGQHADPQRLAELRAEAGLDASPWQRFRDWTGGLLRGDLGHSLLDDRPVSALLLDRLGASLWIAVPTWLLAVGGGTVIAFALALRTGRRSERAGSSLVAAASGVPEVVLVTFLVVVFSGTLGWLPAVSLIPVGGSPADRPEVLVLPVLAVALPLTAWSGRLLRGPAEDILRRPFATDARLRGLSPWRTVLRHGLPHLAAPLAQIATVLAAAALANTAVVETLLAYSGLGQALTEAVGSRDVPVVQGIAVVLAVLVLFAFLAGDALSTRLARRAGAR
ncbi:ABC transporter permease [Streptomyces sp. NPDC049881]|uniref:ABC transporter permease n=1 Tax=Streptomyces sp. NPDC049881 TaxID=3155778 RepID=UPI0034350E82